jgi:hypothetical protein
MSDKLPRLTAMQDSVMEDLAIALQAGAASEHGRAAFRRGMDCLDRLNELKADHIYAPLSAEPMLRDYVSHLDSQLIGLMSRIDVLRMHVELALESGTHGFAELDRSLAGLARQLKASFRREAALIPIYADWRARQETTAVVALQRA